MAGKKWRTHNRTHIHIFIFTMDRQIGILALKTDSRPNQAKQTKQAASLSIRPSIWHWTISKFDAKFERISMNERSNYGTMAIGQCDFPKHHRISIYFVWNDAADSKFGVFHLLILSLFLDDRRIKIPFDRSIQIIGCNLLFKLSFVAFLVDILVWILELWKRLICHGKW